MVCLLLLAGCEVPRDRNGTLERLRRGGEARVGVAHNPPWTVVESGRIGGIEPDLIERWAREVGADVRLVPGPETELARRLHAGELDVLVAGFDKATPHAKRLAPTQVYLETAAGADQPGRAAKHVMAVRQGESATLLSLDRFLRRQDRAALERDAGR